MLCGDCTTFVQWAMKNATPLSGGFEERHIPIEAPNVVLAADEGCYSCNISVNLGNDSFKVTGYLDALLAHGDTGLGLQRYVSALLQTDGSVFITMRYADSTLGKYDGSLAKYNNPFGLFEAYFQHFESGMSAQFIPAKEISYTNGEAAVFRQIRQWLSECFDEHAECTSSPEPQYVPSRLIDTKPEASPDTFLVVETGDMVTLPAYLTISHRWTDDTPRLNIGNATVFSKPTPREKLPLAFQQAFAIVEALGYRYLWIDSLCILQDDRLDMLKEGVMMMQVYSNTICNLSILNGRSDSIFCNRHPSHLETLLDFEPAGLSQGCQQELFVLKDPHLWKREVNNAPLCKRGWVLQEQLLAPRTLYFGQSQVLWECRNGRRCESYPELIKAWNLADRNRSSKLPTYDYGGTMAEEHLLDSEDQYYFVETRSILESANQDESDSDFSEDPEISAYGYWKAIVERYMLRSISFPTDKLLAVAGIAKMLAKAYQITWAAGLWEESLPFSLLWEIKLNCSSPHRVSGFPTWSWASVEAPVSLPMRAQYENVPPLASVLKIDASTLGDDPFGLLSSAILTIKAPVIELFRLPSSNRLTLVLPDTIIIPSDVRTDRQPEIRFLEHGDLLVDINSSSNTDPRIQVEPIGLKGALLYANVKRQDGSTVSLNLEGLILEAERDSNRASSMARYKRVGRFAVHEHEINDSFLSTWQPDLFDDILMKRLSSDDETPIFVDFEEATFLELFEIA